MSLKCVSILFLKEFRESAETTLFGKLFHLLMILLGKTYLYWLVLNLGLHNLNLFERLHELESIVSSDLVVRGYVMNYLEHFNKVTSKPPIFETW